MTVLDINKAHVRERLYIGGEWIESAGSDVLEVRDAAAESVFGTIPNGTAADVDRAARAAAAALDGWAATPRAERAHWITRIAEALRDQTDAIAEVITREVGIPFAMSKPLQAGFAVSDFANTAQSVDEITWEEQIGNSLVTREPVGVVGAITPWNYPLHQIAAKAAPALLAGCTFVVKPSEVAPLSAFLLAEILDELGLPPGVFNLVTGTGPVVGEALVNHPAIDMVSFTGSNGSGRRISELAGLSLKPVSLELGGKSPCIVLDGADLSKAIPVTMAKCFQNNGQTCTALTRLLVPRDLLAEAEEIAAQTAQGYVTGDPFATTTTLGPLVSASQRDRVQGYIRSGIEQGAKLITGGPAAPEGLETGYYVAPTVFSDVQSSMKIAQEEIFGPVLSILPYDGEDDAVRIANDTIYGLSGAVWAPDVEDAKRVAHRIRTGQVSINGGPFNIAAPFGGFKQSGHGRELGRYGIEEFLTTKALQL